MSEGCLLVLSIIFSPIIPLMTGFGKVSNQTVSALFSWSLSFLGMVFGGSLVFISAAEE